MKYKSVLKGCIKFQLLIIRKKSYPQRLATLPQNLLGKSAILKENLFLKSDSQDSLYLLIISVIFLFSKKKNLPFLDLFLLTL